jgi:hypothetical protein
MVSWLQQNRFEFRSNVEKPDVYCPPAHSPSSDGDYSPSLTPLTVHYLLNLTAPGLVHHDATQNAAFHAARSGSRPPRGSRQRRHGRA